MVCVVFAVMQFKVLTVEDLDDRPSPGNTLIFPNYTNPKVASWVDARDQISLPAYIIPESNGKSLLYLYIYNL